MLARKSHQLCAADTESMRCDGPYSRKRGNASISFRFDSANALARKLFRSAKLHKQMRPATALSWRPRDESW